MSVVCVNRKQGALEVELVKQRQQQKMVLLVQNKTQKAVEEDYR